MTLIMLGVSIGILARQILGPPESVEGPSMTIKRPVEYKIPEEVDLPLDRKEESPSEDESGLVEPISIPGQLPFSNSNPQTVSVPDFSHDATAAFHAHGKEICASGCAASHHPTATLTSQRFGQLLEEVQIEPMNRTNNALEELMYYGPQAKQLITSKGIGSLDRDRAEFIWNELAVTHAKIAIRVVDANGVVRTWLEPTRVPFDRRHVFDMKTNSVQPLVTSGTVKRVGLDHIWVRL